jgi:hypothetical protein
MLALKNVPVVIEPGVQAIEAELAVKTKKHDQRILGVCLYRVTLDEKTARHLPLIPTTKLPHVFSLAHDVEHAKVLVVYDSLGRLAIVYLFENRRWDRYDVAEEHAGKAITQFSVRFVFNTAKDRAKFLDVMERMVTGAGREEQPSMEDVMQALRILARSRSAPRVLPVASDKASLAPIKM